MYTRARLLMRKNIFLISAARVLSRLVHLYIRGWPKKKKKKFFIRIFYYAKGINDFFEFLPYTCMRECISIVYHFIHMYIYEKIHTMVARRRQVLCLLVIIFITESACTLSNARKRNYASRRIARCAFSSWHIVYV